MKHRRPPATMQRSAPHPLIRVGEQQDDRSIVVVASDENVIDRYGDILKMPPELDNFRNNPVILAQHSADSSIARCTSISVQNGQLIAAIRFPPAYVNPLSDQYLALIKNDILCGVSVGFLPLEAEAMPGYTGIFYTRWDLLEISIVSIPAGPSCLVIEKAFRSGASFAERRAADLERAEAIRRRFNRTAEPPSAKIAHARAEDVRIREIQAGNICANRTAVSWW